MPIETISGTELTYLLAAFDEQGRERADDPDGSMVRRAIDTVRATPVTDVFIFTHGWMGDIPAARDQYVRWIGAMTGNAADVAAMKSARPGFLPLSIGVHWPSLPYGDGSLGTPPAASFDVMGGEGAVPSLAPASREALVDEAAAKTVDTPAARGALHVIFESARQNAAAAELPPEVVAAYETLDREIGLGAGGPEAAPSDDREPFDPEVAFETAAQDVPSFGFFSSIGDGLLAPLRTLSFWTMKDRARKLGEGQGHRLLAGLRAAADESGRDLRIHLMGHSFGCIVVSAMTAGPSATSPAVPIDSLALIQGAFSLWSYTATIPYGAGGPGYFRRVLDGRVRGPIIVTRTSFDRAVGTWYPWAAGSARQVDFAGTELPKDGAVGAFGKRGPGIEIVDLPLGPVDADYGFTAGKLYNFQCSDVINQGGGASGAHSDFAKPRVAHAVWQAAGARA